MRSLILISIFCSAFSAARAQDAEPPMTLERLGAILMSLDADARPVGNSMELTIAGIPIIVIVDSVANRMRALVPIRSADEMTQAEVLRVLQANFDSALDARYAVAQGRLWAVFIHPLSPLERDEVISGLVQTINLARTYGQSYSGGAQVFGGGDSNEIYRKLFEELQNKGGEL